MARISVWARLLSCGGCLLVMGCAASRPMARVNDCGRGYRVVAVDGQPEQRASHPIYTVVPVVQVPPGEHVIRVRRERDGSEQDVTLVLDADQSYSGDGLWLTAMRDQEDQVPAAVVGSPPPRGRISYERPPQSDTERQAAAAVIDWLNRQTETVTDDPPYDVDLSVSSKDDGSIRVFVVHIVRDDEDRPNSFPGGHASFTVVDGQIVNVFRGL
jgi:hypothetical protein